MTNRSFGLQFCESLIGRVGAAISMQERTGDAGAPYLTFSSVTDGSPAGYLRLWAATDDSSIDRLVHFRLQSPPVDTQLLFLFGRPETPMPHLHVQVVQFSEENCVYNADIIPRLDAVEHPEYFREVYGPVTKAFWKATTDRQNLCSLAPANPAIALYLSPWSIAAGRPTTREELQRVAPSIEAYVDQCLSLARNLAYRGCDPAALRERDQRHLEILHGDELDPRAWKGVYRVLGEERGRLVRTIFSTPLR